MWICSIQIIVFVYLIGRSVRKLFSEVKIEESVESPLSLFTIVLIAEFIHLVLKFIYYFYMRRRGHSWWFLKVPYIIIQVGAQSGILAVMLLIAAGWSIHFRKITDKDEHLLIIAGVFIANAVCSFLTYFDDEEH